MQKLPRHLVWLLALGLAGLATVTACSDLPPTVTPPPGEDFLTPVTGEAALTVEIMNTELAVGTERLAFRLRDASGTPIGPESTVGTEFYRLVSGSTEAVLASSGPAQYFGAATPGGGAWIVYAPFDASGEWGFGLTADSPAGQKKGRLNVQVAAHPKAPRVGQLPPFTESPFGPDAASMTSDPVPDPALYQTSIGQAAESGKPTVILFSSGAHCQSDDCAAALAELKAAYAGYQGRANFIHVETHDMTDPSQLSATAKAWGIPSEPWTFVLDANGRISARAEGILDRTELSLLMDRELAKGR